MTGPYTSYLNPKCESRTNGDNQECGVFALEPIRKDEVVCLWGGRVLTGNELDPTMTHFTQRVLQIDEDLYLVTSEPLEPTDCFNHACNPNLGFTGQIGLIAMRDIDAGEELRFDYAMCDGSPYDEFVCHCGSKNCRGHVSGDDWRNPELWKKYTGYFSPYLARRIETLKRKN